VANTTAHTAPQRQTNFGQLRCFTRAGFAANNYDLVTCNRLGQQITPSHYRQIGGKFNFSQRIDSMLALQRGDG